MGKKAQNAASRKDTFYKRAKERGYRARSAFKLVHLNNLHNFLKKAKVCLDLCAAPGSWMQVAREMMPTGSVIVGVDLFPIKPIPGTISIKGDITTDSLRAELRSTLKEFKADVVLHDGAPNVGKNWSQDAYDQNMLVLHAFKLACEFLRHGGDFITKVFRSKDSPNLEFIFKQLFQKVECTKPQASRYESAEIFYVCQYYKLRPEDKADPKFFDPREVFKEVDITQPSKINLHKPEKISRKVVGYEEGVEVLYKEATVTDFLESDHFEELLQQTNALSFDSDRWLHHPLTNNEIRACCQDIKVLGRKELRALLSWRKALRAEVDAERQIESEEKKTEEIPAKSALCPEDEQREELEHVQQQIEELEARANREDKKQQRAVKKQKQQLQQKLKLISMGGEVSIPQDDEVFSIKAMEKIRDEAALLAQYDASDDEATPQPRPKVIRFKRGDHELDDTGSYYRRPDDVSDSDSDDEAPDAGQAVFQPTARGNSKSLSSEKKTVRFADDSDTSDDEAEETGHVGSNVSDSGVGDEDSGDEYVGERLTTDLVGDVAEERRERDSEAWFNQHPTLNEAVSDDDTDVELEVDGAISSYQRRGGAVVGELQPSAVVEDQGGKECPPTPAADQSENDKSTKSKKSKGIGEKRLPDLDAVGLALASKLIKSKKARRDLELQGWNRYMVGEEPGLPQWFKEDEQKNMAPCLDVDESEVQYYSARDKAVNARTIKKVMEAKVRKQKRFKKTMQKVVKKTEAMQGSSLLSDYEKQQEIKNLYKKAMHTRQKKDTSYVVMKKKNMGKKPKGVKGRYKLVDARLKKDVRAKLKLDKKKKTFGRKKGKKH